MGEDGDEKSSIWKKALVNLFSVLYILGIWLSYCQVCLDSAGVWCVWNATDCFA